MKNSKGFTLIELILAVALISIGTILGFQEKLTKLEQDLATESGQWLLAYNNAVREWISANPGAPASTKTGSAWLKSTTCPGGLSTVAYLPCNFPAATVASPIPGGNLSLTTTISTTGVAPNIITSASTTTTAYLVGPGKIRSDLSGLAALVASSGSQSADPRAGGVDGAIRSTVTTGVISMLASNNGNTDPWLRTDGSNTMNASLKFDASKAANMREIQGVSRLQNIAATALTLGNSGGAGAGYSVIVDANETVNAIQDIANNSNAGNGISITRGGMRTLNGNITASSDITANGGVYAPRLLSNVNGGTYIDPDQYSLVNQVNVYGKTTANIYYDRNNPAYYWNPAQNTNLNYIEANQGATLMSYFYGPMTVGGLLYTNKWNGSVYQPTVAWQACSPKTYAPTEDNMIASCTQGNWNRNIVTIGYSFDFTIPAGAAPGAYTKNIGEFSWCAMASFHSSRTAQNGCIVNRTGDAYPGWGGTWTMTAYKWQATGDFLCVATCNQ
ncbi:type IV pilus modification PilV family protein [Pseudomonas aeruginosa]